MNTLRAQIRSDPPHLDQIKTRHKSSSPCSISVYYDKQLDHASLEEQKSNVGGAAAAA